VSENSYVVAFSGVIAPGFEREQVKQNLAKLFKVELVRVEPMFSGKRVAIKAKLDKATALKYQAALKNAGAVCEVINMAAAAAKPQPAPAAKAAAPTSAAARPTPTTPQWQVDQPATLMPPSEVKPLEVDLSGLSMAEPGVVLVEHQEKVAPAIPVAHLSMAERGSDLVEGKQLPDLQVDLSGLSIAEPGVTLVEAKEVAAPQIDTSQLSLDQ
jgi:hypothetical protein